MLGGMQNEKELKKYSREIKVLMQLFKENVKEEELIKHLEEMNGNISMVIEKMVSILMTNQDKIQDSENKDNQDKSKQEMETSEEKEQSKSEELKKEDEKVEIGEIRPGINLQGYCMKKIA
ncbi:hypothetical protein RFI_02451 [Reticulomyxa filosa]|uniref:Uncharacterized protein n=1 Tax=Reticulomyxa filosa TaxID=46433 RepID=X6P949_RETFI|nr:hypothetical protein RFI_02451 [Reticulomyxa filosa]|eukprot:ETO34638.1 hypothetical protein RFI_02451 [Reticulomyxa filosa]